MVVGTHPDHHNLWEERQEAEVKGEAYRGLSLPTQALLTLGRMCSSSPFSSRQSTCCVLSLPMPKLSACRGEKSSRQICGKKWCGHRGDSSRDHRPLSECAPNVSKEEPALPYGSSLVKTSPDANLVYLVSLSWRLIEARLALWKPIQLESCTQLLALQPMKTITV